MREPRIGKIYRHVKRGTLYHVTGHAVLEADETPMVIYDGLIGDTRRWVRPCSEFMDGRFVEATFDDYHKAIKAHEESTP